ncbi:multifunctional CCA addition/repair protein [Colwellia sp. MEBiC06753]
MSNPTTDLSQLNVFLVGGAVRDGLLNRKITERDYLVVGATPAQMIDLGFTQVGKDFPVFLHPKTKEEYALARTERKHGQGYTGFTCYAEPDVTIEQDLLRRDLTVNAMAQSSSGELIDPYGGLSDLNNRILRHVSPAFSEDPLRVLRVARFAARYHQYGFSVADETLHLMSEISASGELLALSGERVWKELVRALAEPNPEVFFDLLKRCGALNALWPELAEHWINSESHTYRVLIQATKDSTDTLIRFAALCSQIKTQVNAQVNAHVNAQVNAQVNKKEKPEAAAFNQMLNRLKAPNEFKAVASKAYVLTEQINQCQSRSATELLSLLQQCEFIRKPELLEQLLIVSRAVFLATEASANIDYPQADFLQTIADQARQISAQEFIAQGIEGKAIKQAMEAAQVTAISSKLNSL